MEEGTGQNLIHSVWQTHNLKPDIMEISCMSSVDDYKTEIKLLRLVRNPESAET